MQKLNPIWRPFNSIPVDMHISFLRNRKNTPPQQKPYPKNHQHLEFFSLNIPNPSVKRARRHNHLSFSFKYFQRGIERLILADFHLFRPVNTAFFLFLAARIFFPRPLSSNHSVRTQERGTQPPSFRFRLYDIPRSNPKLTATKSKARGGFF